MSLAMYAAPFDNDINQIRTNDSNNDNLQGRKKLANNKTVKKYPKENNSDKVNSILQSIHNLPPSEQDDNYLSDFSPLPPPTSAGVEHTKAREPSNKQAKESREPREPYYNENAINESSGDMGSGYPDNPYMQLMQQQMQQQQKQSHFQNQYSHQHQHQQPQMGQNQQQQQQQHQQQYQNKYSNPSSEHEILLQKLNYMINLLEQNQDERTNNVTEEIVLYSFLGIFIIFIVDSFVRVGKYTR
jgi:hypothetical protein